MKRMRLSWSMEQALLSVARGNTGYDGCIGRSEHGGRTCALYALKRRGLLGGGMELTDAGKKEAHRLLTPNA